MASICTEKPQPNHEQDLAVAYQVVSWMESLSKGIGPKEEIAEKPSTGREVGRFG